MVLKFLLVRVLLLALLLRTIPRFAGDSVESYVRLDVLPCFVISYVSIARLFANWNILLRGGYPTGSYGNICRCHRCRSHWFRSQHALLQGAIEQLQSAVWFCLAQESLLLQDFTVCGPESVTHDADWRWLNLQTDSSHTAHTCCMTCPHESGNSKADLKMSQTGATPNNVHRCTVLTKCTLLATAVESTNLVAMANQVLPQALADYGQKQKKNLIQQDFQKTVWWDHDEHGKDDFMDTFVAK